MDNSVKHISFIKTLSQGSPPTRLDLILVNWLAEYSRAQIQSWIKGGAVIVDGKVLRPKDKIGPGQKIEVNITFTDITHLTPQPIPLNVIYAEQDFIVINKPPGLVTHPGAGNHDNTLLNAILYHYPELALLPRAGIIHRLDKDTSGIMLVARKLSAHHYFTTMFQKRLIQKEYAAVVTGNLIAGGTIEAAIGRHPTKRTLMAVRTQGKNALTSYRIIQRFMHYTYLKVLIATGRTHQIRVHMQHIGHPIVGDPNYNSHTKISLKLPQPLRQKLENFKRQALHAKRLTFTHPRTKKLMTWEAILPPDMEQLLTTLRHYECNKNS